MFDNTQAIAEINRTHPEWGMFGHPSNYCLGRRPDGSLVRVNIVQCIQGVLRNRLDVDIFEHHHEKGDGLEPKHWALPRYICRDVRTLPPPYSMTVKGFS